MTTPKKYMTSFRQGHGDVVLGPGLREVTVPGALDDVQCRAVMEALNKLDAIEATEKEEK